MNSKDWLAPHLQGSISPLYHDANVALFRGDMREVLPQLMSLHNSVCDPPYGIGINGASWDKEVPDASFWHPLSHALLPGAHLLSFWGSRTYHRGTTAIEDGGFEIRDMIEWVYSTGFPKSMDVSQAIDKTKGAKRKALVIAPAKAVLGNWKHGKDSPLLPKAAKSYAITAPATPEAKEWAGWGTSIKPAHEPITVARKRPAGTVASNVLQHGTGALHIDACRIGDGNPDKVKNPLGKGRFPTNVIHDGSEGVRQAFALTTNSDAWQRLFYVAKPNNAERQGNDHPTVKPIALMRYLIRLTCKPGSVMVDPFGGSGTSGIAAPMEGVRCILIEQDRHNCQTIIKRLKAQAAKV